jgi:hypothetical protein
MDINNNELVDLDHLTIFFINDHLSIWLVVRFLAYTYGENLVGRKELTLCAPTGSPTEVSHGSDENFVSILW